MTNFNTQLYRPSLQWATVVVSLLIAPHGWTQETDVQIHLRNGSILNTKIDSQRIDWVDIQQEQTKLIWSDVRELNLIASPVSQQVERVQKLIGQLTSPDYSQRESAEKILSDTEYSGPFKSLIQRAASKTTAPEALYRINRILSELEDLEESQYLSTGFDEVHLLSGKIRLGDASGFKIRCKVLGQERSFDRKSIARIVVVAGNQPVPKNIKSAKIQTQIFNQISEDFYKSENDTLISFENDGNGNPISIGKAVDDFFIDRGLLMRTEKDGFVQLTKYPFKFCPIDSGSRCVCPYDEESDKRLRGVTLLNFCIPGQPTSIAGVHKFGIFLERVEHSRDFVVEAYNAFGQMIGMVEASDRICTFAGFKSNELITQIRISTNTELANLVNRDIDQTYAFDCVTFDPPQIVKGLTRGSKGLSHAARINFRNGDSLLVNAVKIGRDTVSGTDQLIPANTQFKWEQIHSICFPPLTRNKSFIKKLMVQLKDGSIVRVEDESALNAFDFIGHKFDRDEIVGVWNNTARIPLESDFDNNLPTIVYPFCRICAKDLKFSEQEFSWDAENSEKHVQNVLLASDDDDDAFAELEEPDPDLTPTVDSVSFNGASNKIPSLWLSAPKTSHLGHGHVLLSDGQFFVLRDEGFKIADIDSNRKIITIQMGEMTKMYPLSRLVSLSLPKTK